MFSKGKSQADVVYTLGVSRQSASRWHRVWKKGGVGALRSAGRLGRKPQLDADQLGQVDEALRLGPRAHERNEEAVLRWMAQTWPRVKKTPGAKRRG